MDAQSSWLAPVQALKERRRKIAQHWASFGPYYAMFPVAFARQVIRENTVAGDGILDPFAGRGTSIFCAGEMDRRGTGIELNPVGWLYAKTKLNPAPPDRVIKRARELVERCAEFATPASTLPPFYPRCFAPRILNFLLAARAELNWRTSRLDGTLMAIVLNYLHGKIDSGRPSAQHKIGTDSTQVEGL